MKFSINIGSEINLENFSLSQLVSAINTLFTTEGLPGFLKAFLGVIEDKLTAVGVKCKSCESGQYHVHSKIQRKLKTTLGEFYLNLTRLKCKACKKTFVPMNTFLDLEPYSRKSPEFEKLSLETITNQSFRRSAKNLFDTLGFSTAYSTLHRWFIKSPATTMSVNLKIKEIIADGTGFKKKPYDGSNRGEVRVVIGIDKDKNVIPFGAWTRASWKDIGKYIKNKNHASDKIKFKPIAETLITDGEEELIRGLEKLAKTKQRCLFHMSYELKHLLRYQYGVPRDEALALAKDLDNLVYIDIPETDSDPLKNLEDKLSIEIALNKLKLNLEVFIKLLVRKKI